jgi:DNA-binding MarR family transcriptional regulator
MGMEATSLSRTLKIMEEKGLIVRKPNPDDGRSVIICLTDFGIEMREYSKSVVLTFDQKVRERIGEEDLRTFTYVVKSITDLVNSKKVYK